MPKNRASFRKQNKRITLSIIASFLVVITIPLVIWGLTSIPSFDIRSEAANNSPKCSIRFLYVDPNFLEINKAVSMDATLNTDSPIKKVRIWANEGDNTAASTNSTILLEKDYSGNLQQALEKFKYTPTKLGSYTVYGEVITNSGSSPCLLSGGASAKAKIVEKNEEPKFTSQIPSTINNSIKVGDQYNHTIIAEDVDSQSSFGYYYAFTPNAKWLDPKISKSNQGDGTKLQISLQGIADYPASYLVSAFVWDGYNGHTKSQSWVINVDQNENDIPIVTVGKPTEGSKFPRNSVIPVEWSVKDFNMVSKYRLYLSMTPGNQNSWIKIDDNIGYDYGKYMVDTSKLRIADGEYYFIVQAIDNQNPPATGNGLSGKFVYGNAKYTGDKDDNDEDEDEDDTDDGIQIKEAQIINISPTDKSTIKNARSIIKATLVSSEGSTIKRESIKFFLNNNEITGQIKISETSDSRFDVLFTPSEDLPAGTNSVNIKFEDTKGNKADKSWVFTLEKEGEATVNLFGYEIPIRTLIIWAAVAIGIIIIVIVVPWIFYAAFSGKDNNKNEYDIYPTYTSTTTSSKSNTTQTSNNDFYTPITSPTDNLSTYSTTSISDSTDAPSIDNSYEDYLTKSREYANSESTQFNKTEETVLEPSVTEPVILSTQTLEDIEKSKATEYVDTYPIIPTNTIETIPVSTEQNQEEPTSIEEIPTVYTQNQYPTDTISESATEPIANSETNITPEQTFTTEPIITSDVVNTDNEIQKEDPFTYSDINRSYDTVLDPEPIQNPDQISNTELNSYSATPITTPTSSEINTVPTYISSATTPAQDYFLQDNITQPTISETETMIETPQQTTTTSTDQINDQTVEEIDPEVYYRQFSQNEPIEVSLNNSPMTPDNTTTPSPIAFNDTFNKNNSSVFEQAGQPNLSLQPTNSNSTEIENLEQAQLQTVPVLESQLSENIVNEDISIKNQKELTSADKELEELNGLIDEMEAKQNETPKTIYDQAVEASLTQNQANNSTTNSPTIVQTEAYTTAEKLGYEPLTITPTVDIQNGPNLTEIKDDKDNMEDTAPPPTKVF